jgi:hypothetical protein
MGDARDFISIQFPLTTLLKLKALAFTEEVDVPQQNIPSTTNTRPEKPN